MLASSPTRSLGPLVHHRLSVVLSTKRELVRIPVVFAWEIGGACADGLGSHVGAPESCRGRHLQAELVICPTYGDDGWGPASGTMNS